MPDSKRPQSQVAGKHGLTTPPKEFQPPSFTVSDTNNVPDITAAFANLDLTSVAHTDLPSPDTYIADLKLLEAFHQLREGFCLD